MSAMQPDGTSPGDYDHDIQEMEGSYHPEGGQPATTSPTQETTFDGTPPTTEDLMNQGVVGNDAVSPDRTNMGWLYPRNTGPPRQMSQDDDTDQEPVNRSSTSLPNVTRRSDTPGPRSVTAEDMTDQQRANFLREFSFFDEPEYPDGTQVTEEYEDIDLQATHGTNPEQRSDESEQTMVHRNTEDEVMIATTTTGSQQPTPRRNPKPTFLISPPDPEGTAHYTRTSSPEEDIDFNGLGKMVGSM